MLLTYNILNKAQKAVTLLLVMMLFVMPFISTKASAKNSVIEIPIEQKTLPLSNISEKTINKAEKHIKDKKGRLFVNTSIYLSGL